MIVNNLTVRYGDNTVLDNLSLNIPDKGIVLITAPSGYGKTTFFNSVAGLVPMQGGEICGVGKLSYAFQETRLLPWLTALDNVALVNPDKSITQAEELLLRFGLTRDEIKLLPTELSGGMSQRVNLARALFYDGDTILLDEPFSGLDAANVDRVIEILNEYKNDRALLVISHDSAHLSMADYVIELDKLG